MHYINIIVCCSALQCVAVRCVALHKYATHCNALQRTATHYGYTKYNCWQW